MNVQVTFETDHFRPEPEEEKQTNPGRYGRSLARWLSEQLRARGVEVEGIISEDWGWAVMVSRKPFLLWLGCGNVEGSTTEWMVWPVAEVSLFRRFVKRIDTTPAVDRLWQHVREWVPTVPGVKNIAWE